MPTLPATAVTLDEIPEGARSFFELKDGRYALQVQGVPVGFAPAADLAVANGKVVELRDTNIAVVKAVKDVLGVEVGDITQFGAVLKTRFDGVDPVEARALKTKFEGVDPVEYKTLKASAEALKAGGITKPDDVAAQIKAHLDAAITPLTTKISGLETALSTSEQKSAAAQLALVRKDFETELATTGLRIGVDEKMLQPFINHSLQTFQMENGKFVAKNGGAPIFSELRPSEPISPEEWIATQMTVVPGFFKKSNGGGADPAPGALRPGVQELVNPTPQQLGDRRNQQLIKDGKLIVVNR